MKRKVELRKNGAWKEGGTGLGEASGKRIDKSKLSPKPFL